MSDEKIEIIDIDLGINLEEEIKKKADSLNSDITLFTEKLIKRAAEKQKKPPNKKKLAQQLRLEQADRAINILQKAAIEEPDKWYKGWDLAQQAGMEPTPQNVNKLSMMIKKRLNEKKEWALLRKRTKGKTRYQLSRFS